LGNKFLAHIREVDAIVEVVRDFKNDDIIHVNGKIDPEDDVATINLELILADLETVTKRLDALERQTKASKDKDLLKNVEILRNLKTILESEQFAINLEVSKDDLKYVKELSLLTYKPVLYVYNVSEDEINTPRENRKTPNLAICAKLEAELATLPENEVKEYLSEMKIDQTGLEKLIVESYKMLGLVTFLTAGPKETRAWTVKSGTLAPQAAGVIHTDFEKGFVRAEVTNWQDLVEQGGEQGAKEKGLMHLEGKEYEVKDGDTIYFRIA
jgi:GTP-binding protein YchF